MQSKLQPGAELYLRPALGSQVAFLGGACGHGDCCLIDCHGGSCQPPVGSHEPPCQLGGMLAHEAYLRATPDAMLPSANRLRHAVDYLGDMLVAKHDRSLAHRGVEIIAIRLQATGMRKPQEGAVYEVAREFIIKECPK